MAQLVHPPKITFRDFEKVLLRARPTVSQADLETYTKFTSGGRGGARRQRWLPGLGAGGWRAGGWSAQAINSPWQERRGSALACCARRVRRGGMMRGPAAIGGTQ